MALNSLAIDGSAVLTIKASTKTMNVVREINPRAQYFRMDGSENSKALLKVAMEGMENIETVTPEPCCFLGK